MNYVNREQVIFKNIGELIKHLELKFKGKLLKNDYRNITQSNLKFELPNKEVLFIDYEKCKNAKGKRLEKIRLQTIIIAKNFEEIKGNFKGGY